MTSRFPYRVEPGSDDRGFLGRWRVFSVNFLLGLGQETSLLRFFALWTIFVQQLDHLKKKRQSCIVIFRQSFQSSGRLVRVKNAVHSTIGRKILFPRHRAN